MDCVISIIIPFYCTPKQFFVKCMESILGGQNDEIEIIVIDDGSPKEYFSILNTYSNNSQVRIIHTLNAGVSSARNRGIKEASGKWILFVDSDDYLDTAALKKVLAYARANFGDVVLFNGGSDKDGKFFYNTTFLKQDINYAADEEKRIMIMESALSVGQIPRGYRQFFSLGAPYCKLIRTDFLKEHNLLFDVNVKFAEDTLFSLQAFHLAKDIRFVDLNLYYYVFYQGSATRRYRPGLSDDMDVFFKRVITFIKSNNLENYLEKAYYTRVQFEVEHCAVSEFFHPDNKNRNAKALFRAFIKKEPYYTALKMNYIHNDKRVKGDKGIKGTIKYYIILHGYGELFLIVRTIHKCVQSLTSWTV